MRFRNKFKFLYIFIPFLPIFLMSQNVAAVSVGTSSFDLHYKANSSSQFVWQHNMMYGSSNGVIVSSSGSINQYQFNTSAVEAGGSSASIHFETNIVSTWYFDYSYNPWVNLSQQNVIVCNSSPAGATIISRNLGTATTLWGNRQANTLTLYGDVTVSGLTAGTTYTFTCAIGSSDYSFYDINSTVGSSNVWFEQNPLTFSWFTDESQALMQTQINQNETIINLNQQMINNQNQNTEDIINNQNQNTEDIIKSNQRCKKNYLNGNFSQFNNTGGSGSTYGYFKLPDIDDYYLTLIAKNNVTGNSNTFFGFSASGGSSSGGTNWAFNNSSSLTAGQSIIIKNVSGTGVRLNYVSIYSNTLSTFNWFLNNFDIVLTKGSSSSSFIDYNADFCTNFTQEYNDKQYEATDNISNQNSSDIQGSDNQATTNLIGVLSNFLTQLQSFQATNCNLSLPFPQFIGGTQVVNICQGKDVLGNFISVIGTLAMVTFYIPLALVLLKMIYNEIRSFTNG